MAQLRQELTELGLEKVETYIKQWQYFLDFDRSQGPIG
ncbi:hypothetical protein SMSK564_0255 [Streptococcus mitis SK564]|uniref:Uncharacterized protein n=1 Tax=Streptococcus mitis SK564 TaxID=585203 RepID=E1LK78_STRMT|nr:hypothetical protein SMSK564_0255 [Streptococcus mitis SK564]